MSRCRLFAATALGLCLLTHAAPAQHFDVSQGPVGSTSAVTFDHRAARADHIDQVEVFYTGVVRGLRLRSSDLTRTTSNVMMAGSSGGTTGVFQIDPGDYLEAIDINYNTSGTQIFAVTLRTKSGHSSEFGMPSPFGASATLSLGGHEIVGVHGVATPFLVGLGVHLRPAWESTSDPLGISIGAPVQKMATRRGTRLSELLRVGSGQGAGGYSGVMAMHWEVLNRAGNLDGRISLGTMGGPAVYASADPRFFVASMLVEVSVTSGSSHVTYVAYQTSDGVTQPGGGAGGASPPAVVAIAADPNHEIVGLFGEQDASGVLVTLGIIQRPLLGMHIETIIRCVASSTGAPLLMSGSNDPVLGASNYQLKIGDLAPAPASAPTVLLLSAQAASIPLWGCKLLVDPASMIALPPVTTSGSGKVTLPLALPYQPALLGGTVALQAVVMDGASPVLSTGIDLIPGML
ncbi:MAG: jacalin-like lectin [Planctomycetota bacterium]